MPWPAAAVVGGLIGAALLWPSSSMDHDETVQATVDELEAVAPADATVYADHIDGVPNPRGEVDGLTHVPDVVVKAGSTNSLIIEIETVDSLREAQAEARSQVRDFRKQGYRRVLVVPSGQADDETVTSFVEDSEGVLNVATPKTIADLL